MATPGNTAIQPRAGLFGTDLHSFIEQYEKKFPDEVLHIEKPLKAEWEVTALAMRLEKDHRFPSSSATTSRSTVGSATCPWSPF